MSGEKEPESIKSLFSDPRLMRGDLKLVETALIRGYTIPDEVRERLAEQVAKIAFLADPLDRGSRQHRIMLRAAQVLIKMMDHNLEREKATFAAKLKLADMDQAARAAGASTEQERIVVVEDADWYGNDAHRKAAEAPPLPSADPDGPGAV